jgi:hypothetical protein
MKTYGESGGIGSLFLTSALYGAIGQLHAQNALIPGKNAQYTIGQEAEWAPELVRTLWSREKYLSLAGNRTTAVQPVARHYTD